jgi:hypothetical protein
LELLGEPGVPGLVLVGLLVVAHGGQKAIRVPAGVTLSGVHVTPRRDTGPDASLRRRAARPAGRQGRR